MTPRSEHCCYIKQGEATQEIFDTLEETCDDNKTSIEKLNEYFTPKKNVDCEIFHQAKLNNGKTTDQFATRLRKANSQLTVNFTI